MNALKGFIEFRLPYASAVAQMRVKYWRSHAGERRAASAAQ